MNSFRLHCSSWSPPAGPASGFAELARLPFGELVAPDWAERAGPVEAELRRSSLSLRGEVAAGHRVLPSPSNVLRAFRQPLADVRVLIVGQDPYPTPGHAVGLSFAVDGGTRPIPRSLANIYKELEADLGLPPRVHGDLSAWADQGVLLLNRVLSVRAGAAGSHRGKGWETVTTAAIAAVAGRRTAGAASRAPGGRPVGQGCRDRPPPAGQHPGGGQRPPQPAVGLARASSAPGRSAGPTPCCRSRAPGRWTGSSRPVPLRSSGQGT